MENTYNDVQQRIEELFSNEELIDKFAKVKTPDELVDLFKENGVEFTDVSKEQLFDAFQKAKETDELSEDDLENVNGGFWFKVVIKGITLSIGGASAGTVLLTCAGIAAIGLAAYAGYHIIKKKTA